MGKSITLIATVALLAWPAMADERTRCEHSIKVLMVIHRAAWVCKDNSLLRKDRINLGSDACKAFANSDEGLVVAKEGLNVFDFMAAREGGTKNLCLILHQKK